MSWGVEVEAHSQRVLVYCGDCVSAGSWTLACGQSAGWQHYRNKIAVCEASALAGFPLSGLPLIFLSNGIPCKETETRGVTFQIPALPSGKTFLPIFKDKNICASLPLINKKRSRLITPLQRHCGPLIKVRGRS